MEQSIKVKKRNSNHYYEFVKWAYGHKYAVIDHFDAFGDIVRRFIGIARDYKVEPEPGDS